jgi:ABC-type sugar transport system substrate-binding protein
MEIIMNKRIMLSAIALVVAAIAGAAAFGLSASAQTQTNERIIGYSVYGHSQHVLLQQQDGSLRSCAYQRQTALRRESWTCMELPPLP